MPENFRHSRNAGKFPALQKCRKISGTPEVQENFRHSRSAGKFPALQKCRIISGTPEMPENFRHSRNAGKFPALQKHCQNFWKFPTLSYITGYKHFKLLPRLLLDFINLPLMILGFLFLSPRLMVFFPQH